MNPKNGSVNNTRSKAAAGTTTSNRRGGNANSTPTVESEGEIGVEENAEGDDERDMEEVELRIGGIGGQGSNDGALENSELSDDEPDELMNDELEMADGEIADGDGEGEEDRPGEELERDQEAESSEEGGDEDDDEEEEDSSGTRKHISRISQLWD